MLTAEKKLYIEMMSERNVMDAVVSQFWYNIAIVWFLIY